MTFLAPAYLWVLLLAIPLIAIYLLKIKPEQRLTPALFLWHKVVEEKESSALFKKFRSLLSLLLLLLAVIAIVLAMARPMLASSSARQNLLLIIDNSASMAALEAGVSRIDNAKKLAGNIMRNLNGSHQIILATVADKFSIVVNATENLRELNDGLKKIKASDMPLNSTALAFLKNSQNFLNDSRTILISDGCFTGVEKLADIELLKIGKPIKNIGITAFDLVRLPGDKAQLGLYFQLSSSYPKELETDLIISSGTPDNIVKVCPVKLSPGINTAETYIIDNAPNGKWFAKLDHKDALLKDNICPAFISQANPVQVMVAGNREIPFFSMCVEAFQRGNRLLKLATHRSDAVLAAGNIPPESSANKFIIFNPTGKSPFWTIDNKKKLNGLGETTIPEHPGIKFCNIDGIGFAGIKQISPPEGSVILCQTLNNIPLIYKISSSGQSAYVINFDPLESNFFININFPIMISAMLFDLTGQNADHHAVYHTGDRVPQSTKRATVKVNFSSPDSLVNATNQPIKTTIMQRIGFYNSETGSGNTTYAAALLSQADSLLDNSKIKATAKPIASGVPLQSYLFIFALLLIVTESILYHRGKVA
jgi:hypothetical protein